MRRGCVRPKPETAKLRRTPHPAARVGFLRLPTPARKVCFPPGVHGAFGLPLTSEAFGLTDVGKKRPHNEDALLVDPELGLYAVADGMGGHAAGEIASKRAIEALRQHILVNRPVLEGLVDNPAQQTKQAVVLLVEEAVQRACSDIYRLASADPSKR